MYPQLVRFITQFKNGGKEISKNGSTTNNTNTNTTTTTTNISKTMSQEETATNYEEDM